jgi:hypothetical protein
MIDRYITRAFVYIDVKPGNRYLRKLMKHDEVVEGHLIAGLEMYDVVIFLGIERKIYDSPSETISKFVIDKIRKMRDVRETNTIIPTFSFYKK